MEIAVGVIAWTVITIGIIESGRRDREEHHHADTLCFEGYDRKTNRHKKACFKGKIIKDCRRWDCNAL